MSNWRSKIPWHCLFKALLWAMGRTQVGWVTALYIGEHCKNSLHFKDCKIETGWHAVGPPFSFSWPPCIGSGGGGGGKGGGRRVRKSSHCLPQNAIYFLQNFANMVASAIPSGGKFHNKSDNAFNFSVFLSREKKGCALRPKASVIYIQYVLYLRPTITERFCLWSCLRGTLDHVAITGWLCNKVKNREKYVFQPQTPFTSL